MRFLGKLGTSIIIAIILIGCSAVKHDDSTNEPQTVAAEANTATSAEQTTPTETTVSTETATPLVLPTVEASEPPTLTSTPDAAATATYEAIVNNAISM